MSARSLLVRTNSVVGIAKLNECNRTKVTEHSLFYICSSILIFFDKEAGPPTVYICYMECTNERIKVCCAYFNNKQ